MSDSPPYFYLIDGHAQIYRAYFAIRGGMSSPVTGEPSHAVFAFAGMLMKLYAQYRPAYVAMAIDMPGRTFRDEMYSDYKANREPPPDDFHPQAERIFEMTRMFGIPILGVEGAEADDVIATCTDRVVGDPASAQVHVRIVSRDKDLEQLLGPRVEMFDIHKDETFDVEKLQRDKGIRPDQVIDVLSLMGDNADNIPGVDGVGPKTAAKLVEQYGTVDGVLSHIDEIKGKRRANIEAAADRLALNRRLVALKHDVPFEFELEQARTGEIDAAGLHQLFETMGFRRYTQDLDDITRASGGAVAASGSGAGSGAEATFEDSLFSSGDAADVDDAAHVPEGFTTAEDFDYSAVTTQGDLDGLIAELRGAEIVSVDTETIGLGRRAAICGLSFAWKPDHGVYVPVRSPDATLHLDPKTVFEALGPVLEDAAVPKCGHNLKYDAHVLRHAGVRLRGVAFDSMIASQLLGASGHNLDLLARTLLRHVMIPISRLIGEKTSQTTLDKIPIDRVTPYAAEDADMALRLHAVLDAKLKQESMKALAAVEMPLVEVIADMESNGIRVDPVELERQRTDLTGRIKELEQRIYDAAGESFNLDSPKQLGEILFKKLGLPTGKRKKTGPSTDVEVLERLANREDLPPEKTVVPRLIVEYRQLAKLVSTYLGNLRHSIDEDDGRIHASFVQLGAATGRLSSGGPNLQNIPVRTDVGRQIRKAFVAEPDHVLICADYSQIELRILAHLSQDPALIEAFNNDMDIHAAVAAQVFGVDPQQVTSEQRAHAKVINFGIIYGITPYGLARRVEGLDEAGAAEMIRDYRKRFAGIDAFLHHCVAEALATGRVETMLGRRRRIEQINSTSAPTRALGERLAINTVVQGSATGDLIKTAMVRLYRRIQREELPMRILVQIHDELIVEAPSHVADEQARIVREEMEQSMSLRIPLKVDVGIGTDWYSVKAVD